MARPKLRSPGQPLLVRLVLGIYEFCASLKLAVFLIFSLAGVLAWATFVESANGLQAVHFGIYGTWWFAGLQMLLAVCIFCAASIRFPWKRYQTGFVITHIGLLTLLFGCWLSREYGIDAQMLIPESGDSSVAYEDKQHFELSIHHRTSGSRGEAAPHDGSPAGVKPDGEVEVISIPFRGGPFNSSDYARRRFIPWRLARRDQGVVFDHDGVRLEVLDYYSNSKVIDAPFVRLELSMPLMPGQGAAGGEPRWVPTELSVRPARDPRGGGYRYGLGRSERVGGGQISFWLAGTKPQTAAFLDEAPRGDLGEKGAIILHAGGRRFEIRVDEKLAQGAFPLGDTGLTAKIVDQFQFPDQPPANRPGVEIEITAKDGSPQQMVLMAGLPELNKQDYVHDVYGAYWISTANQKTEDLMLRRGGSRIDVILGYDGKLYYRYWNRRKLVFARDLPADGTAVNAFKMPIGQLKMRVVDLLRRKTPGAEVLPVAFSKDATPVDSFRAAKVRLTVDEASEEFWVLGTPPDLIGSRPSPLEHRLVVGKDRVVGLSMPLDVVEIGFRIHLEEGGFERFLDPGTSQAAHYGSVVDFLDTKDNHALRRHVKISMNAPVDFTDPRRGRSYRLFQEAFRGPFKRGDGIFERIQRQADQPLNRDQAYITILTVNYDPGRGIKYIGCALIVGGIAVMFYMRAYFFKPARKTSATRKQTAKKTSAAEAQLVSG